MIDNARLLTLKALLAVFKKECFFKEFLEGFSLPKQQSGFIYELGLGVLRHVRLLDALLLTLFSGKMPKVKTRERILLYMTLYQKYWMRSVPSYALASEMSALAKEVSPRAMHAFVYAFIKNLPDELPSECVSSFGWEQFFPGSYVEKLKRAYGADLTREICKKQQEIPKSFARVRFSSSFEQVDPSDLKGRDDLYIQNKTPYFLLQTLCKGRQFTSILDLCAAPGGKTIALSELYPEGRLVANDISEKRCEKLRSNLKRLNIDAEVTTFDGLSYPEKERFDCIVVDAPCSNSGVFHKRLEARLRFAESLPNLLKLQQELLVSSLKHLAENGFLLYLTCSILKEENEEQVRQFCEMHGCSLLKSKLYLPTEEGFDGGYGALIYCNKNVL